MIVAKGINDAWLKVINELKGANECFPRGQRSKEIKNMSVKIQDPTKRVLSLPIRKISLPFAFGELCWYLSGRNDVDMMEYYSSKMKSFSDDGVTLNSAYGYRIFGNHHLIPFNQWKFVVNKLKEDSDTRQAIIHLHTPNNEPTKDEVCTLSLQFLIRDGNLDLIVNMRSNDIVWGFTYDVFAFTTFQELIANELGVDMGEYYHNAASMHIYEKDYGHIDHVKNIYDELMYMTKYDKSFSYDGITIHDEKWTHLFNIEEAYRNNVTRRAVDLENKALSTMGRTLWMYAKYKDGGAQEVLEFIHDENIYDLMMLNYILRKPLKESKMVIFEGCDGSGKTTYINKIIRKFDTKINFGKPSKDFDKFSYFFVTLMSGDILLDRSFVSDLVYSGRFGREPLVSWSYENNDIKILSKLLEYRKAMLFFMDTNPDICYNRLDEGDKKLFSKDDIHEICLSYTLILRVIEMNIVSYSSGYDLEVNI